MELTKKDLAETKLVGELIDQVNKFRLTEASEIAERIVKNQPFIMSLLIGYKLDVEEEPLEDIMKMLFVIYLYFERKTNISKKQISQKKFKESEKKNIQFLKYFSEEPNEENKSATNEQYLSNLKCKSLFTGILAMSNTQIAFHKIDPQTKGIIVMGMKTLIDCFETNLLE